MTERTLKPGWNTWRFDQMATNLVERVDPGNTTLQRYVGLEHLDSDSLKIRRWGTPDDVIGEKLHFCEGDIIFGKRRAYQRKLAVADFEGICSAHAMVIRVKPEVVLPDFLPFFMQSDLFMNRALEISVGSLSPTINWRSLAAQKFSLPPVREQYKIADVLWASQFVIDKVVEVIEKLLLIKKSQYSEWFTSISNRSGLPKVTLEDVCTIQNGQVDPKEPPYCEMVHLAPDDIEPETGRILELNTAAQDGVISGKYFFDENAIIYSKIRPNLKKVAFPRFEGICSADVYPIYPKDNVLPDFLFQLLLSEDFTHYAVSCSSRSAIPKINREALMAYGFILPPLDEQAKVVDISASISREITIAKGHLQRTRALKNKLLEESLNPDWEFN